MRVTLSDLAFWQYHKAPPPKWSRMINRPRFMRDYKPAPPSIDAVINGHDKNWPKTHTVAHNAIALLQMAFQRLGSYKKYLVEEYTPEWDGIYCRRRLGYYRKWIKRIPTLPHFLDR